MWGISSMTVFQIFPHYNKLAMHSQLPTVDVNLFLEHYSASASPAAKLALAQFASLYTRKLVKRCMEIAQVSGDLTEEDVYLVYENEKGIKSPILEAEQLDRKLKTIEAVNKNALKDLQYTNTEDPSAATAPLNSVQTVRIGSQPYSGFPTGQNFQFCFEKGALWSSYIRALNSNVGSAYHWICLALLEHL